MTLRPHGLQPTRLFCPWDFPGKDTGVGCHFLLQGIFLPQGLNPGLLHCRRILGGSVSKDFAYNAGDAGLHLWVGKICWRREWLTLQYSCLENSMDRGAWWATVHAVQRVGHNCVTYTFSHCFFKPTEPPLCHWPAKSQISTICSFREKTLLLFLLNIFREANWNAV